MIKYPKIQTLYKRDPETKFRTLLEGEWSLDVFRYLQNNEWEFTEKVDGTNVRVGIENGKRVFAGRTDKSQLPKFLEKRLDELFPEQKLLDTFEGKDVVLFGEGYGHKIQKVGSKYIPDGVDFILFDVWVDGYWLDRIDVYNVAEELGIRHVPVIGYGSLTTAIELTKKGLGSVLVSSPLMAEGLVLRPTVPLFFRDGTPVMGKIKHKDFQQ